MCVHNLFNCCNKDVDVECKKEERKIQSKITEKGLKVQWKMVFDEYRIFEISYNFSFDVVVG